MIPRAQRLADLVRGPRVLDVGCTGHTLEAEPPHGLQGQLATRFRDVVGIDQSEKKVKELRDFIKCLSPMPRPSVIPFVQRFGTIVAGKVIEKVSNPGLFLKRAQSQLARGGQLLVSTPFPFSLLYLLSAHSKYPKTCQNPGHVHWFCVSTPQELARPCGLRVSHRELIEDYRPDDKSQLDRIFVHLIECFGWLPKRLRCNSMVFVFESEVEP
jgi:SAM-dependent methyltransferase